MKNESHFLDKQTLIALAFIFLSWFLWERYMRDKYGVEKNISQKQSFSKKPQEPLRIENKKPVHIKNQKEKTFSFENKIWKVNFSSQGLGVKKVKLKKHFDRKKTPIVFTPPNKQYFFEIRKNKNPIYFEAIKKTSDTSFIAKTKDKTISVEFIFEDYFITYNLQVKKPFIGFLELVTANKPEKEPQSFLERMLGQGSGLSLFVKDVKDKEKRFYFTKEGQKEDVSQTALLGLGTRYFGQGWFNQSNIYPELQLQQRPSIWVSSLLFKFPRVGDISSLNYKVFFGPKSIEVLSTIDSKMTSWINFGFLSSLAKVILSFLKYSFLFTKNWGLSIILLTFLIRLLLFPLNLSAYRSMNVMRKIQPKIKTLREKYKKDSKRMNEETLALMKQNKANPFGGCVPMFLQLPIFFALYRVLGESFELYQSPFVFWIQDLSIKDPFYILPILMGGAMYLQQKITPTNMDPKQEKIFKLLPIVFTFFMITLPSGLILYIFVSTLFGLIQQYSFIKQEKPT